jgi:uncharacterized membrane protein
MIVKTDMAGIDPRFIWAFAGLSVICIIILVVILLRKKSKGVIDNTGDPDIMRPKQ